MGNSGTNGSSGQIVAFKQAKTNLSAGLVPFDNGKFGQTRIQSALEEPCFVGMHRTDDLRCEQGVGLNKDNSSLASRDGHVEGCFGERRNMDRMGWRCSVGFGHLYGHMPVFRHQLAGSIDAVNTKIP